MTDDSSAEFLLVSPQQLCVGMFIHLDVGWMDHPFTFSNFKIKSLEQIEKIQRLGIAHVRYFPEKSDAEPLPLPKEPLAVAEPGGQDPDVFAKRARVARFVEQRQRIANCEKRLHAASQMLRQLKQDVYRKPEEASRSVEELSIEMVDMMLAEGEVAVHLMSDKLGGEEVYHHSLNVAVVAMILGRALKAPREVLKDVAIGALLHDIGKIEIPDKILLKTEPLTHAEEGLFRQHVNYGLRIGAKMKLSPSVLKVIGQHHEMADGSGYPLGLMIDKIAPAAAIVALVNAFDNLCNPLDISRALTPHEALSLLYAQQKRRYAVHMVNALIKALGVYPPGTLVTLSNGVFAMVISVNPDRPTRPTLLIHDPDVPKAEAILVNLEEEQDLAIVRAWRPSQIPRSVFDYLSPRKRSTFGFDREQRE